MVKKRQRPIPEIHFEHAGPRVEVLRLSSLLARRLPIDLRQPQRPLFHHLFFVTRGPGVHTVDFRRHRLTAGDVLHVAPGQVQQFSFDRRLDARMVVFEPELTPCTLGIWPRPRRVTRPTTVRRLMSLLAAETTEALSAALVAALLCAVDGNDDDAGDDTALYPRFATALDRQFRDAREVAAYAAILDCSARTLARACEAATGKSAKQLIDQRVALEARRLLAHGGATAADISAQLGFAAPTQFGKFFRRLCGETPARFRARW